jgi:hypothetical protein
MINKNVDALKVGDILKTKRGEFCPIINILSATILEPKLFIFKGFIIAKHLMFDFFISEVSGTLKTFPKEV